MNVLEYELTQEDLTRAQAQILEVRNRRFRESPFLVPAAMILAGLLLWPLWNRLTEGDRFYSRGEVRTYYFLALVLIAGGIVWLLKGALPQPKYQRLNAWSARRMGKAAAQKSVFGPIRIELTEDALVRTNSLDTLRVPYGEIRELLRSPEQVTVRIRRQRRVVLIPTRAFPSPEAAETFIAQLESRVLNKPVVLSSVAGG